MYIECQNCKEREKETCKIDGKYAEPNHIYASEHCIKIENEKIRIREEVKQAIENGIIKIESGSERLFDILK